MDSLVTSSSLKVSHQEKIPTHPFNYEDWLKLLDDDIDVGNSRPILKKIKQESNIFDDYNNQNLDWDHSPQNVNSEATYIWSDSLTQRSPEDFVRLFTEEIIEETIDIIENTVTSSDSDDDVLPPARRLLSSTSAHFLDAEPSIQTPLLPETVELSRVQSLDPALALTAPFLPELVNLNQAQNLDLALAEINLEDLQFTPDRQDQHRNPPETAGLRRSSRLKKTNPKFVGREWENVFDED